jgi:hypothetical protein
VTFVNPSFELPAASGIAGEAADWTWTSVAPADAFPDFNAATAYVSARESFEAGWRQFPRWTYANAAARMAAGGFVAADVNGVAMQADDGSLWALLDALPTWGLIETDGNEVAPGPVNVIAGFGGTAPQREGFERWTVGATVADVQDLLPADDAALLDLGAPYAGMRGWVDDAPNSVEALRPAESFDEGWGADPWTGVAGAPILRSTPLTFPLTLPPERARLWWWSAAEGQILEQAILPGTYATAADLASVLNAGWWVAGLPFATYWTAWTEGASTGVALAWVADFGGADVLCRAWPPTQANSDARALMGFARPQVAILPLDRVSAAPAAFAAGIYLDARALAARTAVAADGGRRVLPPTAAPGSFGTGDREDFPYPDWNAGAAWVASLTLATMGTPTWGAGGDYESFENAAATWPDYYEV